MQYEGKTKFQLSFLCCCCEMKGSEAKASKTSGAKLEKQKGQPAVLYTLGNEVRHTLGNEIRRKNEISTKLFLLLWNVRWRNQSLKDLRGEAGETERATSGTLHTSERTTKEQRKNELRRNNEMSMELCRCYGVKGIESNDQQWEPRPLDTLLNSRTRKHWENTLTKH